MLPREPFSVQMVSFLPGTYPMPSPTALSFGTNTCLWATSLALGVAAAAMLVNQAASSRGGVMASRPDLRLKEGLQKVRDYRAVHREKPVCPLVRSPKDMV